NHCCCGWNSRRQRRTKARTRPPRGIVCLSMIACFSASLEIDNGLAPVAGAKCAPGRQADVVGNEAHRAVSKLAIDAAWMGARWGHDHGHIGHGAGETDARAGDGVRPGDMVISRAAHLAHDPAIALL